MPQICVRVRDEHMQRIEAVSRPGETTSEVVRRLIEAAEPATDEPDPTRVTGRESAAEEAWDRQAELLDRAYLPDLRGYDE